MDRYFKQRIETITEDDFWSSFKPLKSLEAAIAAGQAHRQEQAYQLLGEYHAATLASEAEAYVEELSPSEKLRAAADQVLAHDIVGWHTHRKQFGPKIDFNADFGCSGQYGFHYLGWLGPVLNQYALSGETKYRDCFLDIIKQYYDQRARLVFRHPNLHPVYYELGARAKTSLILPAYAVLAGDQAVGTAVREAMLKLLLGFGRSLYRLQESGFRAGNWQIVGCASLFALGAAFSELREASKWRKRAEAILTEHAEKDFFSDGGHGERCWGYGYMSLSGMVDFYRMALRHKLLDHRRQAFWERFLKNGFRWFAASTTPSGHNLNYGDGSISSAESIFAAACRLFPEMKEEPGLLGVDRSKSNILRPSGYAFMRGGGAKNDPFLSVNFGGWGGGHTHNDLLDFSLWCYGRPLIEEVGRFGSYDNPLDPLFRSEQAHNQIVLEHLGMNRREHQAHDVLWFSDKKADFFSAWHEAYSQARIHRHIIFVKRRDYSYWVIYDVIAAKEYIFQVSNYLHAPGPFELLGPGYARLGDSPSCLVAWAQPAEIGQVQTGLDYRREDPPGNTGDHYSFTKQRHRLVLTKWREVGDPRPITFATLLVPFKGEREPEVSLEAVALGGDGTEQAGAFQITWKERQDLLVFNPAAAVLHCGQRELSGPMAARLGRSWLKMPMAGK